MKYNLKNFPVKGTPQSYERWGKGFEKELREMMPTYEMEKKMPALRFAREYFKEILGEDSS